MEYYRKQAKALVRAHRAGEREAVERARRVLGARAEQRFLLTDAQFVIAREQGCRSWAALRRERELAEQVVQTELRYTDDEPVLVYVRVRGRRSKLHDAGAAVAMAGRPDGWLDVASEVVEAYGLNVNRQGIVYVPAVGSVPDRDWLAGRVGETSLAVYDALLELDDDGTD